MKAFLAFLICAVASNVSFTAVASEFPSKPIKIIHTSRSGAPQDVMFRILADAMSKVAGQPVLVEGRRGGRGMVALSYVMEQPSDGYTISSACGRGVIITTSKPSSRYKITAIRAIYRVQLDPYALYVKRGGQYKDLRALQAAFKNNPKPRVGGFGTRGSHYIATRMWADMFGGKFIWVPFKSGNKAIAAVLGGNLDATMSNLGAYPSVRDNAKIVAITAESRTNQFPKVPTFKELGFDHVRNHWRLVCVKKDMPEKIVQKVYSIIKKAIASDKYQKYLKETATVEGTMPLEKVEQWYRKQVVATMADRKKFGAKKKKKKEK